MKKAHLLSIPAALAVAPQVEDSPHAMQGAPPQWHGFGNTRTLKYSGRLRASLGTVCIDIRLHGQQSFCEVALSLLAVLSQNWEARVGPRGGHVGI